MRTHGFSALRFTERRPLVFTECFKPHGGRMERSSRRLPQNAKTDRGIAESQNRGGALKAGRGSLRRAVRRRRRMEARGAPLRARHLQRGRSPDRWWKRGAWLSLAFYYTLQSRTTDSSLRPHAGVGLSQKNTEADSACCVACLSTRGDMARCFVLHACIWIFTIL